MVARPGRAGGRKTRRPYVGDELFLRLERTSDELVRSAGLVPRRFRVNVGPPTPAAASTVTGRDKLNTAPTDGGGWLAPLAKVVVS